MAAPIRIARFRRCPPEKPPPPCSAPAGSRSRRCWPRAAPRPVPGGSGRACRDGRRPPPSSPPRSCWPWPSIEEDRSRRAPASCSPSRSCWRGRRWPACGLSPGRPCSRWRWRASRSRSRARGCGCPGSSSCRSAFAVLVVAAGRTHARVGPQGDEPHYLMVAESLLRDGDLSLERDYAEGRYAALPRRAARAALPRAGEGRGDLLAPRGRPVGPDPPRVGPGGLRGRHRLHGAPRGARRARGARVGARADRPRRAGRRGRLGVRALPAARPLRRPRVHGGAGGARPVVRPAARAASRTSGRPAPWPSASRRPPCRG